MRGRIVRFLGVGGVTFAIYFFLQYALSLAGFGPLAALSVAYMIAIAFHFVSNALFTFRTGTTNVFAPMRLLKYGGGNFCNYLIHLICGNISLMLGLPIQFGMVTGVVVTTLSGFYFYNKYVFRRGKNDSFP